MFFGPVSGGQASPGASVSTSLLDGSPARLVVPGTNTSMWLSMIAPPVSSARKQPRAGVPASFGTYTRVPRGITSRSVAIDSHSVTLVPAPGPNVSWYASFVTPAPFTHVLSARWYVTPPVALRQPPLR